MAKYLKEGDFLRMSDCEKEALVRDFIKTLIEEEKNEKKNKQNEDEGEAENISVFVVDKGKSGFFTTVKNTYDDIAKLLGTDDWDCFAEYFECFGDENDDSDYEGTLHCLADCKRNFQLFAVGQNIDFLKQLRRRLKGRFIFVAGEDMNNLFSKIGENYTRILKEQFEF